MWGIVGNSPQIAKIRHLDLLEKLLTCSSHLFVGIPTVFFRRLRTSSFLSVGQVGSSPQIVGNKAVCYMAPYGHTEFAQLPVSRGAEA